MSKFTVVVGDGMKMCSRTIAVSIMIGLPIEAYQSLQTKMIFPQCNQVPWEKILLRSLLKWRMSAGKWKRGCFLFLQKLNFLIHFQPWIYFDQIFLEGSLLVVKGSNFLNCFDILVKIVGFTSFFFILFFEKHSL